MVKRLQRRNDCQLSKQACPRTWDLPVLRVGVFLFLPKAKVHFIVLIDLNVHGLDVAGIELVLFTGGHVRPGHFVNLSEDILDVEVYLFLQALTQLLQQGSFLDLVAVAGAEIIQIAVGNARILQSVPNGTF